MECINTRYEQAQACIYINRLYEITNCILCSAMLNNRKKNWKLLLMFYVHVIPKVYVYMISYIKVLEYRKAIYPSLLQLYLPEPESITMVYHISRSVSLTMPLTSLYSIMYLCTSIFICLRSDRTKLKILSFMNHCSL